MVLGMVMRVLHNYVAIRRIVESDKTSGGVIIPATAKKEAQQGEVVAVGPGVMSEAGALIPVQSKVGDRVLIPDHAGSPARVDGVDYVIVRDHEIRCVIGSALNNSDEAL